MRVVHNSQSIIDSGDIHKDNIFPNTNGRQGHKPFHSRAYNIGLLNSIYGVFQDILILHPLPKYLYLVMEVSKLILQVSQHNASVLQEIPIIMSYLIQIPSRGSRQSLVAQLVVHVIQLITQLQFQKQEWEITGEGGNSKIEKK